MPSENGKERFMEQETQGLDDPSRGPRGPRGARGKEGPEGPESPSEEELLTELRKVGSDLNFRMRSRRATRIIGGIAVVALLGALGSGYAIMENRQTQNEACERDNTFRKAYVDQWTPLIADNPLPDPPPENAPQEVKEAYEANKRSRDFFINALTEDFAQHDC
jgi:hypothetical protein